MNDKESSQEAWARLGPMRRRDFLALLGAGAAGLLARRLHAAEGAPERGKPNIVVIVADDLGYADLGCQGGADIPTPHIDSLARNGVRFTNGYVSCPVCSPTRAGLMTGRYQQRFGHEFNTGPPRQTTPEIGLPLTQVTLADVLKRAQYVTGAVGKWHLGMAPQFHPLRRGFDEFFGFLGGSHAYLDAKADSLNPILRGTEPVDEKAYLTDAFSREAAAFVARHRRDPFFLYLAYNAVHTPMQAAPQYLDRFPNIADPKRRTYAAMLSAMDDGIGQVLRALRTAGVYQDTMVVFLSDNGGPPSANASRNAPLRGAKGTLFEGGIRVPFIIRWPRRFAGGRTYDHPAISLDIFPTAVAAAGVLLPEALTLDGVDLMPHLTGEKPAPPHDLLFWRKGQDKAVRKGDWKLVAPPQGPPQLYDLSKDLAETDDLAQRQPAVAEDLVAALARWESGLAQPLWPRPR